MPMRPPLGAGAALRHRVAACVGLWPPEARRPVQTRVAAAPAFVSTRARSGTRKRPSRMTRNGLRPPRTRQVSSGSSRMTVSAPTRTTSCVARSRCTKRRLSSPVIQRDSPLAVAMRPSSDAASLSVTSGSPVVTCLRNAAINRRRLPARHRSSPRSRRRVTASCRFRSPTDSGRVSPRRRAARRRRRWRRCTAVYDRGARKVRG